MHLRDLRPIMVCKLPQNTRVALLAVAQRLAVLLLGRRGGGVECQEPAAHPICVGQPLPAKYALDDDASCYGSISMVGPLHKSIAL